MNSSRSCNAGRRFSSWFTQFAVALSVVTAPLLSCRADLAAGLVAYYPFDGDANDASGHGNNGTVHGATFDNERISGTGSLRFSGSGSSYVIVPRSSSLEPSDAMTIALWCKGTPGPAYGTIIRKANHGQSGFLIRKRDYRLSDSPLTFLYSYCTSDPYSQDNYWSTFSNVNATKWTHLTVTYSYAAGLIRTYIDGTQVDSTNIAIQLYHTGDLYIGGAAVHNGGDADSGFVGLLDDVRIYNRALSPAEVWQLSQGHSTAVRNLPAYQYDGAQGPHAITEAHAGTDGHFSFVFATTNVGARCLVSWTTTLREWFALLAFDATTTGTEVSDATPAPQTFYRTTYLPAGVSPAEGFDYPIGTGASIPEQITPERNDIYPNGATSDPFREAVSPTTAWRNAQDVGAYYSDFGGLHPGEDWNNGSQSDSDVGESVLAVANGQVIEIRAASASGVPGTAGYVMVIRHWLLNGDSVDSLYVHIAPDKNGGTANTGGVIGDKSDFTYQVGVPVTKGSVVAVIGAVSSFSPHLHFEMRNKKLDVSGPLWLHDTDNGYYGPEVGSVGRRSPTISQSDAQAAFLLMQADGIIDPSDFIDDHRQ